MKKITKNMVIGQLVKEHPEKLGILEKNGMHCIGCHIASWETLEQAASSHGLDVDSLIDELNKR